MEDKTRIKCLPATVNESSDLISSTSSPQWYVEILASNPAFLAVVAIEGSRPIFRSFEQRYILPPPLKYLTRVKASMTIKV